MKNLNTQVNEKTALEVFDLACRLYAQQHNQSYSLSDLMQAGIEAHIPPEFIQQALAQVQARQIQARRQQQKLKVILIGLGAVIAAVTVWTSLSYNTEVKLRSVNEIGSGITLTWWNQFIRCRSTWCRLKGERFGSEKLNESKSN